MVQNSKAEDIRYKSIDVDSTSQLKLPSIKGSKPLLRTSFTNKATVYQLICHKLLKDHQDQVNMASPTESPNKETITEHLLSIPIFLQTSNTDLLNISDQCNNTDQFKGHNLKSFHTATAQDASRSSKSPVEKTRSKKVKMTNSKVQTKKKYL